MPEVNTVDNIHNITYIHSVIIAFSLEIKDHRRGNVDALNEISPYNNKIICDLYLDFR